MRPIKNVFVHVRRAWERTASNQGRWSEHEDEGLELYVPVTRALVLFCCSTDSLLEPSENSVTRGTRYPNDLGDRLPTAEIAIVTTSHIAASDEEVRKPELTS